MCKRRTHTKDDRFVLGVRDGWACVYCGKSIKVGSMHVDHFVSVAKGGSNTASNLVASCYVCNMKKGTSFWVPNIDMSHEKLITKTGHALVSLFVKKVSDLDILNREYYPRPGTIASFAKLIRFNDLAVVTSAIDSSVYNYICKPLNRFDRDIIPAEYINRAAEKVGGIVYNRSNGIKNWKTNKRRSA